MTVVNRQTQHYIFPKENTHFNKNANRQRVWQTNAIQVSSKLRWLHLKPHNSSTSVWNLRHCMCLHTVPGRAPQETHWVILLSEMKATGVLTNEQTLHINFKASLELPVNWAEWKHVSRCQHSKRLVKECKTKNFLSQQTGSDSLTFTGIWTHFSKNREPDVHVVPIQWRTLSDLKMNSRACTAEQAVYWCF